MHSKIVSYDMCDKYALLVIDIVGSKSYLNWSRTNNTTYVWYECTTDITT